MREFGNYLAGAKIDKANEYLNMMIKVLYDNKDSDGVRFLENLPILNLHHLLNKKIEDKETQTA